MGLGPVGTPLPLSCGEVMCLVGLMDSLAPQEYDSKWVVCKIAGINELRGLPEHVADGTQRRSGK